MPINPTQNRKPAGPVSAPKKPPVAPRSKPPVAAPKDRVTLSSPKAEGGEIRKLPDLKAAFGGEEKAPAKPDPHFSHPGVPYKNHSASIGWTPGSNLESPTQANQAITQGYVDLNKSMQNYFKGDPNGPELPELADWTTFGKFASREAGEQIRNLEDLAKVRASNDPTAATRLARNTGSVEAIEQGLAMTGGAVDRNAKAMNPNRALNDPQGPLIGSSKELAMAATGTATDLNSAPKQMLNALVRGNNGIYDNFAPAYDAFLKGESDGTGGMEALKKAGYYPGSKLDPQGFMTSALGDYKKARELGLSAQKETDPKKRQELLDERKKLVERGNLNLGNQEQMEVIQQPKIFGDPNVAKNIGAVSQTMAIHDGNGRTPLLPNGGNWSDFATRMGYKEVAPGTENSMAIRHAGDGKVHHYQVDPNAEGTISKYFTDNTEGPRAAKLNASNPKPLFAPTVSQSGSQVDGIARAIKNKKPVEAAAGITTLPIVAGGEGMQNLGAGVRKKAEAGAQASADAAGRAWNSGSYGTATIKTLDVVKNNVVGGVARRVESTGEGLRFIGGTLNILFGGN